MMKLQSDSFEHRKSLPVEFAMGRADGFAPNRSPHLAWSEPPDGTRSFTLLCVDPDVPTVAEMVGKPGVEIPVAQPRTEFAHWVLVDTAADLREIPAGSCSDGVVARGKRAPEGPPGTRQGLNDYTGWFAGDKDMGGDYFGYDGPWPPANDLRPHRYFFRLFALNLARLELPERFTAADAHRAMRGHVLDEVAIYGTYTLNPKVRAGHD